MWLEVAEKGEYPVHFFRYEDLLDDPVKTMEDVFKFVLGVETIEKTEV
jgi:hypothetical protein